MSCSRIRSGQIHGTNEDESYIILPRKTPPNGNGLDAHAGTEYHFFFARLLTRKCWDGISDTRDTRPTQAVPTLPTIFMVSAHLTLGAIDGDRAVARNIREASWKDILTLTVYSRAPPERANVKLVELQEDEGANDAVAKIGVLKRGATSSK